MDVCEGKIEQFGYSARGDTGRRMAISDTLHLSTIH